MMGAMVKTYYAEKAGIDPAKIRVVSVMPCTAKKFEAKREELAGTGYPDVDAVITTRELARMIKEAGIDFVNLPDEDFDDLCGESTGAAVIFGATGGVMEAALRTAYEVLTGTTLENVDFHQVRGIEGVKEADIQIGDMTISVAVANGTGNASRLLDISRIVNCCFNWSIFLQYSRYIHFCLLFLLIYSNCNYQFLQKEKNSGRIDELAEDYFFKYIEYEDTNKPAA